LASVAHEGKHQFSQASFAPLKLWSRTEHYCCISYLGVSRCVIFLCLIVSKSQRLQVT
jgi:hypothetical protein